VDARNRFSYQYKWLVSILQRKPSHLVATAAATMPSRRREADTASVDLFSLTSADPTLARLAGTLTRRRTARPAIAAETIRSRADVVVVIRESALGAIAEAWLLSSSPVLGTPLTVLVSLERPIRFPLEAL